MPKLRTALIFCAISVAAAATGLGISSAIQSLVDRQDQESYRAGETFAVLKDGRRIRYKLRSNGGTTPTILLVAGLGAPIEAWNPLLDAMPLTASVLTYDRAGIGLSDPTTMPMSAKGAARDIVELLDTLSIEDQVVPVCFSLGGLICHVLATKYPDRIENLVLLDPTNPDEWTSVSKEAADRNIHEFFTLIPRQALMTRLGLSRVKRWITRQPSDRFDLSSSHQEGVAREATAIYALHDEVRAEPIPRQIPVTIVSAGLPANSDIGLIQRLHRRWAAQVASGRHLVVANADHTSLRDDPSNVSEVAELVMRAVTRRAE